MFPFDPPKNIRKAKFLGGSKENIGKNKKNENNFTFPWNLGSYLVYILKKATGLIINTAFPEMRN